MSDSVGQALTAVVGFGLIGLLIAMVGIFVAGFFIPGIFAATNLAIAGFGTVLFVGMAFVDFYTMPRTYRDDQYLAGASGNVSHLYQPLHLHLALDHCDSGWWSSRLIYFRWTCFIPTHLFNPGLVRDFFWKISASTLPNLQVVFNPSGTGSVSEG